MMTTSQSPEVTAQQVTIMSAAIETRVEALEQEVTGTKAMLAGKPRVKDWRATFGMSRNDPAFEELVRLGREIREQLSRRLAQ